MFLNKKKNYIWIAILIVFLAYFISIALFDFKIAQLIGSDFKNNWFSIFFDKFGSCLIIFPLFIITNSFVLKMITNYKSNKSIKVIIMILFSFIYVTISILSIFLFEKNDNTNLYITFISVTTFLLMLHVFFINYFSIKLILKEDLEFINKMFYYSCVSLAFLIISWTNVTLFKYIFGRNRPEAVLEEGANFQYVFQINFNRLGKQSTSFPSGHTMSAGQIIIFTYFINLKNPKNNKLIKGILIILVAILTLNVATSRMLMQKHFLTDVSLSMFLVIVYYLVTPIITEKIQKRIIKNG
ncbi:phosphatase PAP2 family protein [Spiroplasma monobiae]|uniref:Phosphatidic acid phosphatase type 2/haloperoxidase domain-containing protein n=1 Tax=Spiroplasma monobiae MQ-1 TaxID=1336748 RepID=A0A2K9LTM8_SPISQ|nr:phosphatase PAP2 family protein [Spiroplasma monobiae]AUM62428.1 hypothetical protein SMONO_v1c01770 [Spiroplasma monobiae MQ-1]